LRSFAWLALAIILGFLGSSFDDRCEDGPGGCCPADCHVSCLDGCSVVPVGVGGPVLAAVELGVELPRAAGASPLELDFPPDLTPPRA